ncbi:tyrosine-type recombinase/integrase [Leucobacter luti]|uniref:tyrosine-type recombinase/integrase n=1 Tax=Leucobacter luti TaxID=340320 RepID=UPI001C68FCD1|nr:tyrosine-type recombinase/integrase [Leucobacter luti]QYM76172.1 tyrosine-type recombinase/integrase [Leucobacter luti]
MKEALAEGLIDVNPCVVVGGKSQRTGIEIAPPRSDAEFEKLLEEMPDEYKALVVVFAAAACRFGEAVDLRADDITALRDWEGEIEYVAVTIDSQVQIIDGIVHQILPKAESVRSVIVSGEDAEIIAERVEGRTGRERLFPARTDPSRPLSRSTFDRHYDRARKAAGMPNTRPYDLRHFAGTRYAQTGATLKEIMARLGHSSPSAALRYQHDADEARRIELATKAGRKRRMNKV